MASDIPITGNGNPRDTASRTITFKSGKTTEHIDFESDSNDEPLVMIVDPGPGSRSPRTLIELGENWKMEIRKG